jgi:glycosyltransferase involved in cell wall biosynthesis
MIISGALPNLSARELTITSISKAPVTEETLSALPPVAEDAAMSTPINDVKSDRVSEIAPQRILLVATEWLSSHGGISSLNRSLAIALAALGNDVVCLVPNATQEEMDLALQGHVRLVSIGRRSGFNDAMLLLTFRPDMLGAMVPKYVIGHDHITGPVAKHISERIAGSRYVHFVHTIPHEIEPYKLDDDGHSRNFDKGEKKSREQLEQCREADLVVAIGPRIADELKASLTDCPGRVFELAPGLDERLCADNRPLPITGAKRCLFMGRLDDPELKGLAIAAEMLEELYSNPIYCDSKSVALIIRWTDPRLTNAQITQLCNNYKIPKHQVIPRTYSIDTEALREEFLSTSMLIMPSRVECFGLVALDAISAGIPVLIGFNSGIVQLLSKVDRAQSNTLPEWKDRTVEVGPDDKLNGRAWAAAVHKVLENRDEAFKDAKAYRAKLLPILSWRAAAISLGERLAEIDSSQE